MLGNTDGLRSSLEQFNLPSFPDRWSQSEANDFFFFAAPETGHQQNASANARFAKGNRLIERGDAEPTCAFLLECSRALDCAVSVSIGFHDRTNRDARADVALHLAKILLQSSQRDFSPGRPSRGSFGDFD